MSLGMTRKGWLYSMDYLNWRRDPSPLILPLYYRSDVNCYACINIKYMSKSMRMNFLNKIQTVYAHQIENELPIVMTYSMLKRFFPPAAKDCYRLYKPYYVKSFSIRKINPTVWGDFAYSQAYINPNMNVVLNVNHVDNPGGGERSEGSKSFAKRTKPSLTKGFKSLKTSTIKKSINLKSFSGNTVKSPSLKKR